MCKTSIDAFRTNSVKYMCLLLLHLFWRTQLDQQRATFPPVYRNDYTDDTCLQCRALCNPRVYFHFIGRVRRTLRESPRWLVEGDSWANMEGGIWGGSWVVFARAFKLYEPKSTFCLHVHRCSYSRQTGLYRRWLIYDRTTWFCAVERSCTLMAITKHT